MSDCSTKDEDEHHRSSRKHKDEEINFVNIEYSPRDALGESVDDMPDDIEEAHAEYLLRFVKYIGVDITQESESDLIDIIDLLEELVCSQSEDIINIRHVERYLTDDDHMYGCGIPYFTTEFTDGSIKTTWLHQDFQRFHTNYIYDLMGEPPITDTIMWTVHLERLFTGLLHSPMCMLGPKTVLGAMRESVIASVPVGYSYAKGLYESLSGSISLSNHPMERFFYEYSACVERNVDVTDREAELNINWLCRFYGDICVENKENLEYKKRHTETLRTLLKNHFIFKKDCESDIGDFCNKMIKKYTSTNPVELVYPLNFRNIGACFLACLHADDIIEHVDHINPVKYYLTGTSLVDRKTLLSFTAKELLDVKKIILDIMRLLNDELIRRLYDLDTD